tara:strand:+ start:706 stop:1080 length:375 start_codon:yes stop_codon:yes gene_type:complete
MTPMNRLITQKERILTAFILGLSCTPLVYIALGALFSFGIMFSVILLPPYLLAIAYIFYQRLWSKSNTTLFQIAEYLCIGIVVGFTILISDFNLQTTIERIFAIGIISAITTTSWWIFFNIKFK